MLTGAPVNSPAKREVLVRRPPGIEGLRLLETVRVPIRRSPRQHDALTRADGRSVQLDIFRSRAKEPLCWCAIAKALVYRSRDQRRVFPQPPDEVRLLEQVEDKVLQRHHRRL